MNVTFAVSAAYFFLNFGIEKTRKKYAFLAGAALIYMLFLWWWDQSPAAVTAICALPFLVALLFFYRPEKKEAIIFYTALGLLAFISLLKVGFDTPARIIESIWNNYLYITKDASGDFPNIGITISEQSVPSLDLIINYTTHNIAALMFAVFGIFMLFRNHRKTSLFLISIIFLSVATLTANRFMIFMIPLLALGSGCSMSVLWNLRKRFPPLYILCPIIILLLVWPLYSANKAFVQWPKEPAVTAEGMYVAKEKTPENAVI